jgi:hypothetical protein
MIPFISSPARPKERTGTELNQLKNSITVSTETACHTGFISSGSFLSLHATGAAQIDLDYWISIIECAGNGYHPSTSSRRPCSILILFRLYIFIPF